MITNVEMRNSINFAKLEQDSRFEIKDEDGKSQTEDKHFKNRATHILFVLFCQGQPIKDYLGGGSHLQSCHLRIYNQT